MGTAVNLFDSVHQEILKHLEERPFIFIIRSGDFLFDEAILKELEYKISGNTSGGHVKKHRENNGQLLIGWQEIFSGPMEFMEKLSLLRHSGQGSQQRDIFILPNGLFHILSASEQSWRILNSCIFLSEKFEKFKQAKLNELMHAIQPGMGPNLSLNEIPGHNDSYPISLGKFSLLVASLNQETQNKVDGSNAVDFSQLSNFLDDKGISFVNKVNPSVSLESVAAFFKSFIYVHNDHILPLSLELSEITASSRLSPGEIDQLLTVAQDESFQLLVKKGKHYMLKIPEYLSEWKDLIGWITQEKYTFLQYRQLKDLADDYFKNLGPLLSKEQIERALLWDQEVSENEVWEKKYQVNRALISSYILLSQEYVEDQIKSQQKKRARLLKNSIRVSIAVSIAFLLSSFTALIAYLERNSAIKQQELALMAKQEAEDSRATAEIERAQAIEAQENERIALEKAERERLLALESKEQADIQKANAIFALDLAKASEQEASIAREIAEKNEQLAYLATQEAEINFNKSEKLRNQQEARATALEALALFDNGELKLGVDRVQEAFQKNLSNEGFPLQSEIFKGLLMGKLLDLKERLNIVLDFPARHLTLSPDGHILAVYTIDAQIHIFRTGEAGLIFVKSMQTPDYIKDLVFHSNHELMYLGLQGGLYLTNWVNEKTKQISKQPYTAILNFPGGSVRWMGTKASGGGDLFEIHADSLLLVDQVDWASENLLLISDERILWADGTSLFMSRPPHKKRHPIIKLESPVGSMAWSEIHGTAVLGLENGQVQTIRFSKNDTDIKTELFSLHASRVSHIEIVPYAFETELMMSTGYDGNLNFFVFNSSVPISSSVSSKITVQEHRSWIRDFALDRATKTAYSVGNDRMLKIWPLSLENLLKPVQNN